MITAWRVIGIIYTVGVALAVRDKYREREARLKQERMPDSIEDQLDIMIHTTEIESRSTRNETDRTDNLVSFIGGLFNMAGDASS